MNITRYVDIIPNWKVKISGSFLIIWFICLVFVWPFLGNLSIWSLINKFLKKNPDYKEITTPDEIYSSIKLWGDSK